MKNDQNKVLFLTLSVFSETGGIQKVCRTLSKTLMEILHPTGQLQVLSLCDLTNDLDTRYLDFNNFRGFGNKRLRFCIHAIKQGLTAKVIILSHINLIFIARLIKTANPTAQIIVLAHGTEIWRPITWWKVNFIKKRCLLWSVSQFTSKKIQELHGVKGRNIAVLHNCLDPFFSVPSNFKKPSHLLNRYHIKDGAIILLGISRMASHEYDKGYDDVISSIPALLKMHPNLCYLLAGKADAMETARLNARIMDKGLQQHVKLIGYIKDDELSDHYLLADIFIMISKKEGFGLVFLEAAACGCKIICGNIDGSSEAVLHGKLGKQINPSNTRQLQLAVSISLQGSHDSNHSKNLQKMCMEHFGFLAYNQKVKQLLTPFIKIS